MYVTLAQLAEIPGAQELAQVATADHLAVVDAVLMDLTLRAGDRSSYDPADTAAADAAKVVIESAIEQADDLIDAYLARRVTIPRDPVPGVLVRIARNLARYDLHKALIGSDSAHPILRDYRDSIRLLEAIRDGKVTLGATDPVAATDTGLGDVRFEQSAPVFGRTSGTR